MPFARLPEQKNGHFGTRLCQEVWIQYQVNRTTNGWVVELVNDAGVVKKPNQPAITDPSAIARVMLRPRTRTDAAREWRSNRSYPQPGAVQLDVGPGQSVFVEFVCR